MGNGKGDGIFCVGLAMFGCLAWEVVWGAYLFSATARLGDYRVNYIELMSRSKFFNPKHSFVKIGSGCKITSKFIRNTTYYNRTVEALEPWNKRAKWKYTRSKMVYSCIGYTYNKIGVDSRSYEACSEQNFSVGQRVQCWQFSDEVIDAGDSLKSLDLKYHYNCDETPNYSPAPHEDVTGKDKWLHRCKYPGSLRSDSLWGKQNHGKTCIDEKKNLCMLLNKDRVSSTTWENLSNKSDSIRDGRRQWRTKTIDPCCWDEEKRNQQPRPGIYPLEWDLYSVPACDVSRAFDEANDECVRIDYPTEKAPDFSDAASEFLKNLLFFVTLPGLACLILLCSTPKIYEALRLRRKKAHEKKMDSSETATSGQVSIEMSGQIRVAKEKAIKDEIQAAKEKAIKASKAVVWNPQNPRPTGSSIIDEEINYKITFLPKHEIIGEFEQKVIIINPLQSSRIPYDEIEWKYSVCIKSIHPSVRKYVESYGMKVGDSLKNIYLEGPDKSYNHEVTILDDSTKLILNDERPITLTFHRRGR